MYYFFTITYFKQFIRVCECLPFFLHSIKHVAFVIVHQYEEASLATATLFDCFLQFDDDCVCNYLSDQNDVRF